MSEVRARIWFAPSLTNPVKGYQVTSVPGYAGAPLMVEEGERKEPPPKRKEKEK